MKIKQLIKNSILGAMLLPAIMMSGCTEPNKPNKPQEEKDPAKDGIGVIIENVTIDGVPVSADDLRAVGRKDIVHFTGATDGEDLIQLEWKPVHTKGDPMLIRIHAKPNLYLKDFKYRYRQTDPYETKALNLTTYGSDVPLKNLSETEPQKVPTTPVPEDEKNVYVTLEYGEVYKDFDCIMGLKFESVPVTYALNSGRRVTYKVAPVTIRIMNLKPYPLSISSIEMDVTTSGRANGSVVWYNKDGFNGAGWELTPTFRGGDRMTLRYGDPLGLSGKPIVIQPMGQVEISSWIDLGRSYGDISGVPVYLLRGGDVHRGFTVRPPFNSYKDPFETCPWARYVVDGNTDRDGIPFVSGLTDIRLAYDESGLMSPGGILVNCSAEVKIKQGTETRHHRLAHDFPKKGPLSPIYVP